MSRRMRRVVLVLAAAQVADAIGNSLAPRATVAAHLDHLGVPGGFRPLLSPIKLAGAAGLVIGLKVPRLGVAASGALVSYYAAAAEFHLGAGDGPRGALPATVFGATAALVLVNAYLPALAALPAHEGRQEKARPSASRRRKPLRRDEKNAPRAGGHQPGGDVAGIIATVAVVNANPAGGKRPQRRFSKC